MDACTRPLVCAYARRATDLHALRRGTGGPVPDSPSYLDRADECPGRELMGNPLRSEAQSGTAAAVSRAVSPDTENPPTSYEVVRGWT
jgi:hypothetical protein